MLPAMLQQTLISSFMSVFTSPLRGIHDEFSSWKDKMKIMISGTPQVCMLEKIIKDSLDIDIVISEGDGRPVDFVIQTNFLDVDKERQLFALIDRYKLAGKAYGYINASVLLGCEWSEYICERKVLDMVWEGYVCEVRPRTRNYVFARISHGHIYAKFEYPPMSDIRVIYAVYRDNGNNGIELVCSADFRFYKGESRELSMRWFGTSNKFEINVSLSIYNDDYYNYSTAWQ